MTKLAALKKQLMARSGSGAKYGLERLGGALDALGHPERDLKVVHVAGTNGKGSVCATLEAMAGAAEMTTGTFTSPHLCRLEERIRIGRSPIDDEAFVAALERVMAPEIPWVTFFETITLAAFVAMRQAEVELAILEVGLGGRLDATNVVPPPRAAAIVSVSRDHTRILGSDLAGIAREKAGILKRGTPAVFGRMPPEALAAAAQCAREAGAGALAAVVRAGDEAAAAEALGITPIWSEAAEGTVLVRASGRQLEGALALSGPYQADNAAVAIALAWELGIDDTAVASGLASASWPGRFERLRHGDVEVLFDCAHNEQGAAALSDGLASEAPERTILVFGAMGDKDWTSMLDRLAPHASRRFYAPPLPSLAGRKPAPSEALAARHPGSLAADPEAALEAALGAAAAGDLVVVAGSIFLVGSARASLLGLPRDLLLPL